MDANDSPAPPDWIREYQAPAVSPEPSSPSSSSAKSDSGEIKVPGTSRTSSAGRNNFSRPSPKTVSKKRAAGGKGVGTPKAKSKRNEEDEDYVPSPKKPKRLANPSPKKVIVIDDDEEDEAPNAGLSEVSLKTSRELSSVSTRTQLKEPASKSKSSFKQTNLKSLFSSGLALQEVVSREEQVASQVADTGTEDLTQGTQEIIETQLADMEDEEVADLKNDVVGSQEPRVKAKVPSSLPLVFPEKVNQSKVLVECAGDDLDLSGDMGAIGRFIVCGENNDELQLDLKGVIYKAGLIPCSTCMVVNIGQTEAKVEAVMDSFMQLKVDRERPEDETIVEGTLDGFEFGSDDEGDRVQPTPPAPAEGEDNVDDSEKKPKKSSQVAQKTKKVTVKKVKVTIKVGKGARGGKAGAKGVASRKAKGTGKPSAKSSKTKKQARK